MYEDLIVENLGEIGSGATTLRQPGPPPPQQTEMLESLELEIGSNSILIV